MKATKKGFSLKWGLMGIIIGCWLVPMLLTLGSLAYYTTRIVRRQFDDSAQTAILNAAGNGRRGLSAAVTASRNASYGGTVRDAYLRYKQNGNRQILYERLTYYLTQQYRYDDNILATMLFLVEEPSSIYYTFNPTLVDASYSSRVLDYRRYAHDEAVKISEALDTNVAFCNTPSGVYMVRNIVDSNFSTYAVIVMQLNTNALFGSFSGIVWESGATVWLNGTPVNVSSVTDGETVTIPEGLAIYPGELSVVDEDGSICVYGRESSNAVEMLYAVRLDMRGFLRSFVDYAGLFYLLLFLLIPLLMLAVWFFYRNIFNPMDKLSSAARSIQEGELGYRIDGYAKNAEFAYLTEAFNDMSVRLKRQFERIYSEELALRDARIMALQSQINPHFLNNTLEIINWEARLGNNDKVSKMIEALATMLDAAMDRKSSPLVPLSQEMMYVDAYLYIISVRFGKRLNVRKDIDGSLLQYEVPRLIMQPIIENAVEHGIGSRQTGVIIIRAKRDGENMLLEVENNGLMSEDDIKIVLKLLSPGYDAGSGGSLHLGIHNVNLRLKMIYGEKSGLKIVNSGSGTVASLNVPIDWKDVQN